MDFALLHPADQLVMIMERIYQYGMTTTSGGNLSIREDNGDVWITPGGIDKGSLTRDDMMCIRPDGTVLGKHRPSVELPFHQSVYRRRPDLRAVLHAHPPALVAFSIVRRLPDIHLIPNVNLVCGDIAMAPYAVPGSELLGENIATQFDRGFDTVVLENHGVVLGSDTLFHAFMAFETLEFCARLQLQAVRLGTPRSLEPRHIEISRKKNVAHMEEFVPERPDAEERGARRDLCRLIRRSYDQRLFTSTQGTFSVRLAADSFLITPYGKDRKYLEPEDLVLIRGGLREAGKHPSRSVALHRAIYAAHPEQRSVIVAHPPYIMAFAVTDAPFDSRTIPESYILLKSVRKVPFGASFLQPALVADMLAPSTPVVLCENDCVIVAGTSLLQAFDRLEVAEYSANSIVHSRGIGSIVPISDAEVAEIDRAFP
jgi:L-fuculose-phosphate aldolase